MPEIMESTTSTKKIKSKANGDKKPSPVPIVIPDHITILTGEGGEPDTYQCNICTKQFKTKVNIKYHNFCPSGGEKPFKCETCGQGFISKSHYEYHLRTHTGERPFICPKCGKGFSQKGKVTVHLRSHTGERPFVCEFCARGFITAQALKIHNMVHTGEKAYSCQFCDKSFTVRTNLIKHAISHTDEKPFKCVHCDKSFGLKWSLDLHLKTHSNEKPYACDQCDKAFIHNKDLKRHLVTHSGERPFKCWICGYAIRRKENLERHITTTHNQPREVAKQLVDEAAAEYLASQKAKAPTPTIIPTNLNDTSNKTNSPRLAKGASTSMSNDKSKKIQGAVDKFITSVKKQAEYTQNNSIPLCSLDEEVMRLLNDITPPDITSSIENGQLSIHVKMGAQDIEDFGEPESTINKGGKITEKCKTQKLKINKQSLKKRKKN